MTQKGTLMSPVIEHFDSHKVCTQQSCSNNHIMAFNVSILNKYV